jgi:hypothetical protein
MKTKMTSVAMGTRKEAIAKISHEQTASASVATLQNYTHLAIIGANSDSMVPISIGRVSYSPEQAIYIYGIDLLRE